MTQLVVYRICIFFIYVHYVFSVSFKEFTFAMSDKRRSKVSKKVLQRTINVKAMFLIIWVLHHHRISV